MHIRFNGFYYKVVDMRWGVQDSAGDDHSTSTLCLDEIINCQNESIGPTFIVSTTTNSFSFCHAAYVVVESLKNLPHQSATKIRKK